MILIPCGKLVENFELTKYAPPIGGKHCLYSYTSRDFIGFLAGRRAKHVCQKGIGFTFHKVHGP